MALTTVKLTPHVGAEIKTDAATLLSGKAAAEVRAILEQRGVIVCRGMNFDDAQLSAFSATLGTVLMHGSEGTEEPIIRVTLDKNAQRSEHGGYFQGTFYWHMDNMHGGVPPLASILSPRVLSPAGGETEFVNTYASYEDLPESEKKALEGVRVVHSVLAAYLKIVPNPTEAQLAGWRAKGEMVHPLVWHHRSGRKSLVNGHTTSHVVGMDRKEGDALLKRMMEWATQPKYVYQHTWQMGDLLMWDNTGTMHRVLEYDRECGRRLHRVTLLGEEPVAAAA